MKNLEFGRRYSFSLLALSTPNISPGLTFVRKHFLMGLYTKGGLYTVWTVLCVSQLLLKSNDFKHYEDERAF